MANAARIIRQALSKLGLVSAGQPVSGEDAEHCLLVLNTLLDAWDIDGLYAFQDASTTVPITSAQPFLTIGEAQEINVARPIKIETSSFSRVSGVDRPIKPLNREEFNAIEDKDSEGSYPEVCFFDGGYPTGRVYFWPLSDAELTIVTKTRGLRFTDLTTDRILGPGEEMALVYTLAAEVAPDYGTTAPPAVVAGAMNHRRAIQKVNAIVPSLGFDEAGANEAGSLFGGAAT